MAPNAPPSKPPASATALNKRKEAPSSSNASKKGGPAQGGGGAWPAKRLKMSEDRKIVTQEPGYALKDGELNLQTFLKAREFEIKALEESMRHTKGAATKRAFQQVPRGMRRRTASHNVKKVPKRLRNRAIKEMREDNTPTVTSRRRKPTTTRARIRAETARKLGILAEKRRKRKLQAAKESGTTNATAGDAPSAQTKITTRPARPKIRRNELNDPPKPKCKFRKRQMHKTWLPTHLWHAKRARMTEPTQPLWRFAIPLTPNEKIYRATHRGQGERGAVAWDMSYMSTIGLYGNENGVEKVLRRLGITQGSCWNERGLKWRAGTRHWNGMLSKDAKHGRRFLCPATVLWNPPGANQQQPLGNDETNSDKHQRQLFLRVHPSAFLGLFNELLRLVKMQTPKLFIEDLRFELGSIEITGPASTETLLGVLQPYFTEPAKKQPHADMFAALTSATTPAAMPPNSVLAFSVLDPRLRYPPRRTPPPDLSEEGQSQLMKLLSEWPAEKDLKPYAIFDRNHRFEASRLPSHKSVSKRKGARVPGTDLDPGPSDPPIPILLLASRPAQGTQAQGTWTVVAPFKCIQSIWYSLVHFPLSSGGNPRFAGLNEARQVPFERGLPYFPVDFLGTDAGAEWEIDDRARRQAAWERRPKSKRTAWETLDLGAGRKGELGDGWACDLEYVLHLKKAPEESAAPPDDEMEIDGSGSKEKTKENPDTKAKPLASHPLKELQHMSKPSLTALLSTSETTPPNSIVTISLILTGRGVANPCARIYRLPSRPAPVPPSSSAEVPASAPPLKDEKSPDGLPADLRGQWLAQLPNAAAASRSPAVDRLPPDADMATRKRFLARTLLTPDPLGYPPPKPNQTDMNGHPLVPSEEDLIGFVTTGAYCLSEGRGRAVGCVAVEKVVEGLRDDVQRKKNNKKEKGAVDEGSLCIVRNAGESVGWLARWEAV
ncbi:hypothetical protein ACHAQA_002107 [Verticillium albo-atrum]